MNIPNQITVARLLLAIVLFTVLSQVDPLDAASRSRMLTWAFWLFLVAVLTDILDGYLARAWQQVTPFGRVVDPVVDKVVVCGAFLYLASHHFYDPVARVNLSGVEPWMVVLILLRELLVSALRAQSESGGGDFGASAAGKLKMFVQSTTVCVVLGHVAWFPGMRQIALTCVWITVVVTFASILPYVYRGRAFLAAGPQAPGGGTAPPTSRNRKPARVAALPRVSEGASA